MEEGNGSNNGRWVSPDEILAAAKQYQLNGREPITREDWAEIMNFVAYNVMREIAAAVCDLFAVMYDVPLSKDEIGAIVAFQSMQRLAQNADNN